MPNFPSARGSQLDSVATVDGFGNVTFTNDIDVSAGEIITSVLPTSTRLGDGSLSTNTSGSGGNTGIGRNAGDDITSGDFNVVIGSNCDAGLAASTNRIVIGNTVAGTANFQFSFGVVGSVVSNDFGTDALWSRASDVRKKQNIVDSQFGLDFINKQRPVEFNWKEGWGDTSVAIIGLIAQEVERSLEGRKFNGHVVREDGFQELKMEAFIPVLINAVKELSTLNAALVKRIENLES